VPGTAGEPRQVPGRPAPDTPGGWDAARVRMAELEDPDTAATRLAAEVVRRFAGPAMVHHAVRSWWWAAALGAADGIAYDPELLKVAALLHDLGLEPAFDTVTTPFEVAGGDVAWVFAAGAGWPAERRDRVAEVVVRHMWDTVDPAADPEGHLLERATALDISGRAVDAVPADLRAEVLERWPRLDLAAVFTRCLTDQAARKPDSAAAAAVRSGLPGRLAAHPLDP
jgi:hypothetical protein